MRKVSFIFTLLLIGHSQILAPSLAHSIKRKLHAVKRGVHAAWFVATFPGQLTYYGGKLAEAYGPVIPYAIRIFKKNPIETGIGVIVMHILWKKNKALTVVCSLLVLNQFKRRYDYAKKLGKALEGAKKIKQFKVVGADLVPIDSPE